MYSVFLVEDEIVIREGIKKLVAWEEYGFRFCGEAPDGELAWGAIQKEKPDIVITDIKMPFMDGLELSALIKKELPDTIIIILSGYDDFAYAQQAVNIGVNRYLLKPLSKDKLTEVLLEVKRKKEEEESVSDYDKQFAMEVQAYLSASRRDFFEALISGKYAVPQLLKRAAQLDLDVSAEAYNVVLLLLDEILEEDHYSSRLGRLQENMNQFFTGRDHYIMFHDGLDITAIIVKSDKNDIEAYTQQCVEKLQALCEPLHSRVRWRVQAGYPVMRLSGIADAYKAARKQLLYDGGTGGGLDYDISDANLAKDTLPSVMNMLTNAQEEEVEEVLDGFFAELGEDSMRSLLFRHHIVLSIQYVVEEFLSKLSAENPRERLLPEAEELEQILSSEEASRDYLVRILKEAIHRREQAVTGRYKDMLMKVEKFMQENYADPEISLRKVAKVANMTPTHFSAVFSQERGRTFVEYLTELRMEKARELLKYSNLGSSEISFRIGYNDPHYFSFLFKKIHGISPRDFRAGKGESV